MPSAAVLAYLLSTLAIISSADARKQVLANLDQFNGYTRQQIMPRVRQCFLRIPQAMFLV